MTQEELDKQIKKETIENPLYKYHRYSDKGKPYDIKDAVIADEIIETVPLMVINSTPYIYVSGVYKCDRKGNMLKGIIKKYILQDIVKVNFIERVYKLIIIDGRVEKNFSEINKYPKHFINFKDGMFDVKEWKLHEHDPKYLSVNQIPHKCCFDESATGSHITTDAFLNDVIPDEADRFMLWQYIGYCMTIDTSIQKFLILQGMGGTGKSAIIRLIEFIVGQDNLSNVSMQDLNKRFFATNLLGKQLNSCADLPSTSMEAVDVIKKIVGEDTLMGEIKGGDVFSFKSYAKLLFSANHIPINLDEKTDAFYRRLLIIKIDKRGEEIENLEYKLQNEEVSYSIFSALRALGEMYKHCEISESSNSLKNVLELYKEADTVTAFIDEHIEKNASAKERREKLYKVYDDYCKENERTSLTKNGFYKNLRNKGFIEAKNNGNRYFKGISFKDKSTFRVVSGGTVFD